MKNIFLALLLTTICSFASFAEQHANRSGQKSVDGRLEEGEEKIRAISTMAARVALDLEAVKKQSDPYPEDLKILQERLDVRLKKLKDRDWREVTVAKAEASDELVKELDEIDMLTSKMKGQIGTKEFGKSEDALKERVIKVKILTKELSILTELNPSFDEYLKKKTQKK